MKLHKRGACHQKQSNLVKSILGLMLFLMSTTSFAMTIILNESNGYEAEVETGVTIFRSQLTGIGPISLDGGEFAIGVSDVAMFPGQNSIGDGDRLGGFQPRRLADNATAFTIRADGSGNLYDVILTYFQGERNTGGIVPDPLDGATAVFEVTAANPIPIPAAGWLLLSALGTLGLFKKQRTS